MNNGGRISRGVNEERRGDGRVSRDGQEERRDGESSRAG